MVLLMVLSSGLFLALGAWGWGGFGPMLGHPARLGMFLVMVLVTLAAMFADISLEGFRRTKSPGLWMLGPITVYTIVIAYLPAYTDRAGLWVLDGDAVRYAGLALFTVGCVLRVGPMFALGKRFTWPLATHEEHRLVTTGWYRTIRNPSYSGAVLGLLGWVLVFRSGIGLVLALLLVPFFIGFLPKEEAILRAEFGAEYEEYCKRTWRLIPFVY